MSNCDITIEFIQPKPIVFEFKTDGSAQQTNPVIEQRLSDLENNKYVDTTNINW